MILIGRIIKMYTERQSKRAHGERVLRQSSTLSAANEVWSDVAASLGLGFRAGDSGPLLHGELPGGARLEIGVYERDEDTGGYVTVASAARDPEGARPEGSLELRPLEGLRRVARTFVGAKNVPSELAELYLVRASDDALVTRLLDHEPVKTALVASRDRAPMVLWEGGDATMALEGVELTHERLEEIVRALDSLTAG